MSSTEDFSTWTNENLIERINVLETQLRKQNARFCASQTVADSSIIPVRNTRRFDPTKYCFRKIVLKLAYLGQQYNGLEHHANNSTPLPTIEEELWNALWKTKLIFPTSMDEHSWEGCDYSKCGRTDKGVSAFGQVIGLRVRSARQVSNDDERHHKKDFDEIKDELPYARILNRVLPDDIRILAWCPAPTDDFSARFSCKERQYRYFFTQPAFSPGPGVKGHLKRPNGEAYGDGWLNISRMQEAAKIFEGLHDFRNFCKVDPARQITKFERRIFFAGIEEYSFFHGKSSFKIASVSEDSEIDYCAPKVYSFTVHGSAFLWHQIRHMVAILFLVGQGLEPPSIISDLLDPCKIPEKPMYEMATDAPLVLWNCIFPSEDGDQRKDALRWTYTDSAIEIGNHKRAYSDNATGRFGIGNIIEQLWSGWRRRKIDEVLAGSLLECMLQQLDISQDEVPADYSSHERTGRPSSSQRVFDGGNNFRMKGQYVPVLKLKRTEAPEIVNARYLARKPTAAKSVLSNQSFAKVVQA